MQSLNSIFGIMLKPMGLGGATWVYLPALLVRICVSSGNLVNLSKLQFLHSKSRDASHS